MRKLKLQMQVTVDGFVAGPERQLDWITPGWDEQLIQYTMELTDSTDTILMGRKMTAEFTNYWENVLDNDPANPEYEFAKRMVAIPKIAFSKIQQTIAGRNVIVENGDLVTAVNALKQKDGRDMIVYGGANFVSSLVENDLIDEFYFFVNKIAIGKGLQVFNKRTPFELETSTGFKCGIVVNKYTRAKS